MGGKARARFDWSRALAALALALLLWIVVHAEEEASGWVRVNVGLTLDAETALTGDAPPVHALVSGKRRELFKLLSAPPTLQRAVTSESGDSARLELRAQDVDLPPTSELTVRDIRPRLLLLSLRHRDSTPARPAAIVP